MSILKCKMCGGELNILPGDTIAECEYCGTKQTLPRLNNDRKANLFDRASHLRRMNDYDKAMSIYEQILAEDETDAELYWSLVLCRYGIEYVEDPRSHKRIPTVNRAHYSSILMDEDYLSALQYADFLQKEVYEEEAKVIDKIQKTILSISQTEEPYDVFICYKETDNYGKRTIDSVLAQDLYKELTNEGLKVFFSRITLEDKLGTAYEPYIFAALSSAKVMVVVSTKPEHFNAVWVKNEWSRYLSLIRKGERKTLIPAYRDMDPYDLPEEFSHLQAQDMSKLGFMQDLVRGVLKIVGGKTVLTKEATSVKTIYSPNNSAVAPLLRRAEMFRDEGNDKSAKEYLNRVLDMEPENGHAYLQLLLLDFKVNNLDELFEKNNSLESNLNYQRLMKYADEKTKLEFLNRREEVDSHRKEKIYQHAIEKMQSGLVSTIGHAKQEFESIIDFKDSRQMAEKCSSLMVSIPNEHIYTRALQAMKKNKMSDLTQAFEDFESIPTWKDSAEKAKECRQLMQEIKNDTVYEEATLLMETQDVDKLKEAAVRFEGISKWKDSALLAEQCLKQADHIHCDAIYDKAMKLLNSDNMQDISRAVEYFESISYWLDASIQAEIGKEKVQIGMNDQIYGDAMRLMQSESRFDLQKAMENFWKIKAWKNSYELYQDCQEKMNTLELKEKAEKKNKERKKQYMTFLGVVILLSVLLIGYFKISSDKVQASIDSYLSQGEYRAAQNAMYQHMEQDEADAVLYECAEKLMEEKKYYEAYEIYNLIPTYKDAQQKAKTAYNMSLRKQPSFTEVSI